MIDYIGRTVLLVRDYDEAVAYYREKLGFEVIFDQKLDNGFRAVHIGLPSQPGVGLWLSEAAGERAALIGKQSAGGPFLVMYTRDCGEAVSRLEERGVKIVRRPAEEPGSIYAHLEDLYGNEIVLVQLREPKASTGRR